MRGYGLLPKPSTSGCVRPLARYAEASARRNADRVVRGGGRVEHLHRRRVQRVVAAREQRLVLRGRPAPVRARVRLVPDDDGARVGDERERGFRVPAEAPLLPRRGRRLRAEAEHGEHDGRLACGRLRARELDAAHGGRRDLAAPRHPHAHRVRADRLLALHDGERERRPLERVVVHADDAACAAEAAGASPSRRRCR